ncbi:MAG TPA: VanZ family protein [Opitutaceae bacterium]|nr:VanZ family protein [Opitutaceae bacterium]
MLAIFLASGQSQVAGPQVVGFDKVAHFFAFGSVATGWVRVFPRRYGLWVIFLVSLHGISDEWRQSFTVGRSVEVADWMADTLGATVAVVAYLYWSWYRKILETPLRWPFRKRRVEKPHPSAADSLL